MTSRYIKFARQYEKTHSRLREELAGGNSRLAAESAPALTWENRTDETRPSVNHPPIDPTAANNPWWVG